MTTDQPGRVADPREWTAGQITEAIALAVKVHDFKAVVALIKMLAVRDPRQAEVVYESMLAVLSAGRKDATTEGLADG
jgi:hypothetical protein